MVMSTLPLTGGRKKPTPKPRTEGVVILAGRLGYYARLYPSGAKRARYLAKRARYLATRQTDVIRAQEVLPYLRAEAQRRKGRVPMPNPNQMNLL